MARNLSEDPGPGDLLTVTTSVANGSQPVKPPVRQKARSGMGVEHVIQYVIETEDGGVTATRDRECLYGFAFGKPVMVEVEVNASA